MPRPELGQAPLRGDAESRARQCVSRLQAGMANPGLVATPHPRLPVRNPRGDAARGSARADRSRAFSRLARARPAAGSARGAPLESIASAAMAHAKREFPLRFPDACYFRFPDACYFRFARGASISSMIASILVVLFSPPKRQRIDFGRQLEQADSS